MRSPDWFASVQHCTSERVSKDGATRAKKAFTAVCLVAAGALLPAVSHAAMNPAERAALVDLYNTTGGPDWLTQGTWLVGDPCDNSWDGITCNADRTSVIQIYLPYNNMTGSLPSLSSFPNLLYFLVNNNQLTGTIPSLINNPALVGFNVSNNQLTGSIPAMTEQTAWNTFNVSYNQLTGSLPELTGVGVATLRTFAAEHNQLTGTIPSFTGADRLLSFRVGYNKLSGSIPTAPPNERFQTYYEPKSEVCPNFLSPSTGSANDLIWDSATLTTPWSSECTVAPTPEPVNDSASTNQGQAVSIDLRANDTPSAPSTSLTLPSIVQQPANGTVTVDASGLASYTPNAGFNGTDTFSYEVCQEEPIRTCATAQVTVVVNAVVTPPGPSTTATPVPALGGLGALLLTGLIAGAAGYKRRKKSA